MGLKISKALSWQLMMWAALLACVAAALLLFLAALDETHDADSQGRRLSIMLKDGAIQGKIHQLPQNQPSPDEQAAKLHDAHKPPQDDASEPKADTQEMSSEESAESDKPTADFESASPLPPVPSSETTNAPDANQSTTAGDEPLPPALSKPEEQQPLTIIPAAEPLPAPNSKLLEKTSAGQVPAIASDGSKSWEYYARPFGRQLNEPLIALVITGLGHSRTVTEKAYLLPAEISLSFSPYAPQLSRWVETARLTAHETLIDLPLEPPSYPMSDPGPYGLLIDKGLQENENRLRWVLSRGAGFVGVATPYNEVYSSNSESFRVLLQSLANRGLMLLVSREPARSETKELLDTSSTPHVVADLLVDEDLLDSSIDSRLAALEQEARKKGYAVGVIQATPLSLERVRVWAEGLESRGIRLAPVSAVVRLRFS
jgi:polysaccharide deacetylase 2 family uncharacterized protein YibQ